ncbi:MAG: cysteine--tRNA ligase [Xanthobacteraceae bacterium]
MELKLYDTLTREKRVFTPLDPSNVRMYVCGPTVYDFAHIGNARPVIVFDVLFRLLRHRYGADHVTYVRNITDVDDKINARAAEEYPGLPLNEAIRKVTDKTDRQFLADVAALGCLPPTVEPRATEHIAEMRTLIERLVVSGHAYVAENNVLFNVPSMPDYGRLSKKPLDELIAGARVEIAPYKRHPQDFVLWKPSAPGEPAWPSPAGIAAPGRPGWHIECSAMSWKHLGEVFDIHGGGIDLVFPHHENEIAQSRCAFHTPVMANFWMHNGFLQVEGEKMSKSLGNFVTIHEMLNSWNGSPWTGSVIRLAMLSTHYRQPMDWTLDLLMRSRKELSDWCLEILPERFNEFSPYEHDWSNGFEPSPRVFAPLMEDLNFPACYAQLRHIYSIAHAGNEEARVELLMNLHFLGLVSQSTVGALSGRLRGDLLAVIDPERMKQMRNYQVHLANQNIDGMQQVFNAFRQEGVTIEPDNTGVVFISESDGGSEHIERLIAARNGARAERNYQEADRIRDELAKMGVVLKDSKDGTTWEIAR